MFKEIEDQLNEYDGIIDYEKMYEENNDTIKTDKRSLSVERKNAELIINYKNISEITIKFYLIDVELLYTTNINLGMKMDFGEMAKLTVATVATVARLSL